MNKKSRKIISWFLMLCMLVVLIPMKSVKADEKENETKITISVNGTVYENVQIDTECIIGDMDINDVDVKILSVNGHELQNVGTKSGVLDNQGRTVLEFNPFDQGNGVWNVRMCYHDVDDPVESNHGYGFDITGLVFKKSSDSKAEEKKAASMKNVKLTSASKAIKASWKKVDCTGYQLQYSTSKSKLASAKKIKISSKKTSYTIKQLKASKTYYVRIRTYEKYMDFLGNERIVYGSWKTLSKKTGK